MNLPNEKRVGAESRTAYNEWHGRYETDVESDAPWHRLVKDHIELERDVSGKKILEIGCGRGGFACWLARQSPQPAAVTAADFSGTAIAKGRDFAEKSGTDAIFFEVGDILAIPHRQCRFDTVISCETIEHVPDPQRAIVELTRVLKPGGRLFLTTPNYIGTTGLYRIYMKLRGRKYTEEGQPINHALLAPLTASWVRKAKLEIEKIDGVGHYLHVPKRAPMELPRLNSPRWLMRWFGLHNLIIASKPLKSR